MTEDVDVKNFDDYEAFNSRNQLRKSALFNSKPENKDNDQGLYSEKIYDNRTLSIVINM